MGSKLDWQIDMNQGLHPGKSSIWKGQQSSKPSCLGSKISGVYSMLSINLPWIFHQKTTKWDLAITWLLQSLCYMSTSWRHGCLGSCIAIASFKPVLLMLTNARNIHQCPPQCSLRVIYWWEIPQKYKEHDFWQKNACRCCNAWTGCWIALTCLIPPHSLVEIDTLLEPTLGIHYVYI